MYNPLTRNKELGTMILSTLESSEALSVGNVPVETYTKRRNQPYNHLKKEFQARGPSGEEVHGRNKRGGLDETERFKYGQSREARERFRFCRSLISEGLAGHSEGLGLQ